MCVLDGGDEAWLSRSPMGSDEQAAANSIAHAHNTYDDWWRREGGLSKAQVSSFWDQGQCAYVGGCWMDKHVVDKQKEIEQKQNQLRNDK